MRANLDSAVDRGCSARMLWTQRITKKRTCTCKGHRGFIVTPSEPNDSCNAPLATSGSRVNHPARSSLLHRTCCEPPPMRRAQTLACDDSCAAIRAPINRDQTHDVLLRPARHHFVRLQHEPRPSPRREQIAPGHALPAHIHHLWSWTVRHART